MTKALNHLYCVSYLYSIAIRYGYHTAYSDAIQDVCINPTVRYDGYLSNIEKIGFNGALVAWELVEIDSDSSLGEYSFTSRNYINNSWVVIPVVVGSRPISHPIFIPSFFKFKISH